ncbi:HD-GYP domain-containing protein [Clostridiaceae bacterium 35-E11]
MFYVVLLNLYEKIGHLIVMEDAMRLISLKNAAPEMIVGKSIYSCDGDKLLSKGVKLTNYIIKRLYERGIYDIYIEDEISTGIEIEDVINQETRNKAKKSLVEAIKDLKINKNFDAGNIKKVINKIVDELLANENIMINLSDLRSVDEYTFAHSVNVAVLSIVVGKALGYNQLRLRDLGVGAILHDIGKIDTPNEILNKPQKLNDDEMKIMREHTVKGYEILRKCEDMSSLSKIVALLHHERFDGSGYPFGKKNSDIHEFAKIVAITDMYDAMTSNRVYKKKINPNQAIEYLIATSTTILDYDIVKVFLNHISVYPIGTIVLLNTKEKAIVIDNNRSCPTRPIVRVFNDKDIGDGRYREIDLQKNLTIFIEKICDE